MKKEYPKNVYQIKIALKNIKPLIWRRVLVADNANFHDLHAVIQGVFGWWNYHLHEFRIGRVKYGDPDNDDFSLVDIQDENDFTLAEMRFSEGTSFTYEYDFGDGWEHSLKIEKIIPFEKMMKLPQCIAGKRACPPEDVGGRPGYEEYLTALADPKHEQYEQYLEWRGEFDAEYFDLDETNQQLAELVEPKWPGSIISNAGFEQFMADKFSDPLRWAILNNKETQFAASAVPIRRDVNAFLTYMTENKVIGTKALGNLPRKAIEEIAAQFVKPVALEVEIGTFVSRFNTEDDVWPIYFVHVLVDAAGLIKGGLGKRWQVTSAGENFLSLPPALQVWQLFATWWYKADWTVAVSFSFDLGSYQQIFAHYLAAALLALPSGESQLFDPFVDKLLKDGGRVMPAKSDEYALANLRRRMQYVAFDPLVDFGVIFAQYEKFEFELLTSGKLKSFSPTELGHKLLKLVYDPVMI